MPIVNGAHRAVTIAEWLAGATIDGFQLDIEKSNAYRANRGLAPHDERKPFKIDRPKQAVEKPAELVGDELTKLIKEYGLKPSKSCGCESWAAKMNAWGIDGCREHRAEIVAHLNTAYHAATWWETMKAAGSAVKSKFDFTAESSLPLTLGGMVDEAIRRVETSPGK